MLRYKDLLVALRPSLSVQAAAQSAVQSQENVPGNLSAAIIRESAKSALRSLKTWELPYVTLQ